jgi:predicted ATPase
VNNSDGSGASLATAIFVAEPAEKILDRERDLVSYEDEVVNEIPALKLDSSSPSEGSSHTPRFLEPVVATL